MKEPSMIVTRMVPSTQVRETKHGLDSFYLITSRAPYDTVTPVGPLVKKFHVVAILTKLHGQNAVKTHETEGVSFHADTDVSFNFIVCDTCMQL